MIRAVPILGMCAVKRTLSNERLSREIGLQRRELDEKDRRCIVHVFATDSTWRMGFDIEINISNIHQADYPNQQSAACNVE